MEINYEVFIEEIVLIFKLEEAEFIHFLTRTGKFQFLVNYEFKFVARYLQNTNFTLIKCDIPDEVLQKAIN